MKFCILFLAIISQVSATTVNCLFGNDNFVVIGVQYSCLVNRIELTGSQTVLGVTGFHLGGRNNSHVKAVRIVGHGNLPFIITGFTNFFPNLIGIDQSWNNIGQFNGDEFDEYPNLEFLNLEGNHLGPQMRHIPGNFLSLNGNMRVLLLTWTSISTIGENFLNVVARLNYADFILNHCIDQMATTPAQIQNLVINLRNNCTIQEVTTSTVAPPGSCDLHETVCELKEQNAEISARLDEMNKLLLELVSRPCGR